jgi:hypothetical protein
MLLARELTERVIGLAIEVHPRLKPHARQHKLIAPLRLARDSSKTQRKERK